MELEPKDVKNIEDPDDEKVSGEGSVADERPDQGEPEE